MNSPQRSSGDERFDVHRLAAAYALDALDGDELQRFEQHLAGCADCRVEVADFHETAAQIASSAAVTPRPSMRADVLAAVAATRQSPPLARGNDELALRRRRTSWMMAAAAAVVGLVAVGGLALARRDDALTVADRVNEVMTADDRRLVTLSPSADAVGVVGALDVAWTASDSQLAVVGRDVAPLAEGEVYALWLIDADGPVAVGSFRPNVRGEVQLVASLTGSPVAWGVTVEAEGFTGGPTLPILYQAAV